MTYDLESILNRHFFTQAIKKEWDSLGRKLNTDVRQRKNERILKKNETISNGNGNGKFVYL